MKEKKKRYRCLWLMACVMLLLPFYAGATGKQDDAAIAEGELIEIHWMMRNPKTGEEKTWCMEEMEKTFNVKIIPSGYDREEIEKVQVALASGEFPDCGYPGGDSKELWYEEIIRTIPEQMIRTNMPNYTKLLDEKYPLGWLIHKSPDNDKEYLTILSIMDNNSSFQFMPTFRVDWAKKVGFELPDYQEKKRPLDQKGKVFFLDEDKSLEWLESLLVAFRDKDPDGNGKNDTIPWGACNNRGRSWAIIAGAFGVDFIGNFLINGQLYYWSIAPGYKDFVKCLARWYSEGLIDKEFVTLSEQKMWEKIGAGQVAANSSYPFYTGFSYTLERPPNNYVKDEEIGIKDAEAVMIPPPVGPAGFQGAQIDTVFPIGAHWFVFNKSLSDKKTIRILQILDYFRYGDDEHWMTTYRGKAGIHFKWSGEPWDSQPIRFKPEELPEGYPKQGEFGSAYPFVYTKDRVKFICSRNYTDFYMDWLLGEKGQKLSMRPYKWDLLNETELTEVRMKYGNTLDTLENEFFYGAITGQIDIDSEWDSYVQKWRKNGGDKLLVELQKAPLVHELLKGKLVY